jgi:NADH-quinone oxidoreductase subunit J
MGLALPDILFYVFAALTLLCALLVVVNPFSRNPVTSAMFLVLTIISMAGLFVLLHAFFLAAVQVLVYAGAVIVLFLFVIMLLDLKEEERRRIRKFPQLRATPWRWAGCCLRNICCPLKSSRCSCSWR